MQYTSTHVSEMTFSNYNFIEFAYSSLPVQKYNLKQPKTKIHTHDVMCVI